MTARMYLIYIDVLCYFDINKDWSQTNVMEWDRLKQFRISTGYSIHAVFKSHYTKYHKKISVSEIISCAPQLVIKFLIENSLKYPVI